MDPRIGGNRGIMTTNSAMTSAMTSATTSATLSVTFEDVPEPSFRHLRRMSDSTGLLEHARGPIPLREHGYCVDDVSRGLLIVCREPDPDGALTDLADIYLTFLAHAQNDEGAFHNRLGYDRVWHDTPELRDWWGRALWGLGTAASRGPTPWIRQVALECFEAGAIRRSPFSRSMAFAALGAAEVLDAHPGHTAASELLADAAKMFGRPRSDSAWPWPEDRLTYGNAVVPEVLMAAGNALGDPGLLEDGLRLLEWLLDSETHDGHLSLTPVGGWGNGEERPGFDQQPIEAAGMADACARAFGLTGDPRWLLGVRSAVDWFLGDNDANVSMLDEDSGGGCDGLLPGGRNGNQGAESTLALLSTLQHGRRLAGSIGS